MEEAIAPSARLPVGPLTELWRVETEGHAVAAAIDSTQVIVESHFAIHKFDIITGSEIWEKHIVAQHLAALGSVVVAGYSNVITALDASDGGALWGLQVDRKIAGFASDASNLYVLQDDGSVVALDAVTGVIQWRSPASQGVPTFIVYHDPVVIDHCLVWRDEEGHIHSIRTYDGAPAMSLTTPDIVADWPWQALRARADHAVVIISKGGRFDPGRLARLAVWNSSGYLEHKLPSGCDYTRTPIVAGEGVIVIVANAWTGYKRPVDPNRAELTKQPGERTPDQWPPAVISVLRGSPL
jgi:hypothetical protein